MLLKHCPKPLCRLLSVLLLASVLSAAVLTSGCRGDRGEDVGTDTETDFQPTYDGTGEPPLPGGYEDYAGVIISAVYGTGDKNPDAAVSHGFIQLYNVTDHDISLSGASLYLKNGTDTAFVERFFPEEAVIPAGGYFLVRAASPEGYGRDASIFRMEAFDLIWDVLIDNKQWVLLLAPSGLEPDGSAAPLSLPAVSLLASGDGLPTCSRTVDSLSKNKMAVKTDLLSTGGYHVVDLTRTAAADLGALCPRTSDGRVNSVGTPQLLEVVFSHKAGVYDNGFDLVLSAPEGMEILYTLDGTDPRDSLSSRTYTAPIPLGDTSAVSWGGAIKAWNRYASNGARPAEKLLPGGHIVKACAVGNGTESAVFTHSYFIGSSFAAYKTMIVSLSIPVGEMLGRDGFYSNYLPTDDIVATRPRGLAVMEVFDADGARVGNSAVELAVSGNGSSGSYMKSMRVYYKGGNNKEGDLESSLNYNLFGGLCKDSEGHDITSFSRLVLRNSGNDCGESYLRDAFMQRACAGLNVDTLAAMPALVFVNGDFWGVYNVRERYSPEYVEAHYGVDKNNVTLLENDYEYVHTDCNMPFVVASGEEGDQKDFNDLVDFMKHNKLSSAANYKYVCDRIDIDSFIDMYACRLFWNARDWPENNIKVWRNKNPDDPSGMDTKWHFTLLDMDMGLSLYDFTDESSSITDLAFNRNSVVANMVTALMKNKNFEKQLAARVYQVANEHFTTAHNSAALVPLRTQWGRLIKLQEMRWPGDGADFDTWNDVMGDVTRFLQTRTKKFNKMTTRYFGFTEAQLKEYAGMN